MLEYPLTYNNLSLDSLALSLPPYHVPLKPDDHHDLADDTAASDVADSPPSALSSYSPYAQSHDHLRSRSFDSSDSPPTTSAGHDDAYHQRLAVEDARFAFTPPPQTQPYFYDRRQSEPNAVRYRPAYHHAASAAAS